MQLEAPTLCADGAADRDILLGGVFAGLHQWLTFMCPLLVAILVGPKGAFVYLDDLVPIVEVPPNLLRQLM